MALFRINYASKCLNRYKNLNVILPAEDSMMFDVKTAKEKPEIFQTLYLLHGYSGNQEDWLTETRIQEIAERYRLAVVMPSGENSFYLDRKASNAKFETMIAKEIVDFTRSVFPLSKKREDTFIGGLSMGGYGALRLGSCYPDTFGKIFGLSSALVVDDIQDMKEDYVDDIGEYALYQAIFEDLTKVKNTRKDPIWCAKEAIKQGNMPELYLACGTEDFLIEKNRRAVEALRKTGFEFHYHESSGIHDWDFWNKEIGPAIRWLLDEK